MPKSPLIKPISWFILMLNRWDMIDKDNVDHFITASKTELLQKCLLYSGNNSHIYPCAYSCSRIVMMIVSAVVFFFFFFCDDRWFCSSRTHLMVHWNPITTFMKQNELLLPWAEATVWEDSGLLPGVFIFVQFSVCSHWFQSCCPSDKSVRAWKTPPDTHTQKHWNCHQPWNWD